MAYEKKQLIGDTRGRPARPRVHKIRLIDEEIEAIRAAARARNMTISAWIREAIERALDAPRGES